MVRRHRFMDRSVFRVLRYDSASAGRPASHVSALDICSYASLAFVASSRGSTLPKVPMKLVASIAMCPRYAHRPVRRVRHQENVGLPNYTAVTIGGSIARRLSRAGRTGARRGLGGPRPDHNGVRLRRCRCARLLPGCCPTPWVERLA
jgi:hypothetical protein